MLALRQQTTPVEFGLEDIFELWASTESLEEAPERCETAAKKPGQLKGGGAKSSKNPTRKRVRTSHSLQQQQRLQQAEKDLGRCFEQLREEQAKHESLGHKAWVLQQLSDATDATAAIETDIANGGRPGAEAFKVFGSSPEAVRDLSPQQYLDAYKGIQVHLGRLMLQRELNNEPVRELHEIQAAVSDVTRCFCHYRPKCDCFLFSSLHVDSILEDGSGLPCRSTWQTMNSDTMRKAPEGHWKEVARSLKATQLQACRAHALHQSFSKLHRGILHERCQLASAFGRILNHPTGGINRYKGLTGSTETSMLCVTPQVPEADLINRLEAASERERKLHHLVLHVLYLAILDQDQICQLMVQSYPWVPDDVAILYELACQAGQSSLLTSLTHGPAQLTGAH